MFHDLDPSICFGRGKVIFQDEINWAIKFLRKDDRIVWYLSVIQKFVYLFLSSKPGHRTKKFKIKCTRKLHGFDEDRILADFNSFSHDIWEHLFSVQEVYSHSSMLNYPFYDLIDGRSVPRTAEKIVNDFKSLEIRFQNENQSGRYCSDGEIVFKFSDGWAWFAVKEGFSRQEAMAMKHCGNGAGKSGDILLSLREPVLGKQGTLYKPHLTFILNNGLIGEAKGFANQKPGAGFEKYIEALLKKDFVKGVMGGGYLPQNNFQFSDLSEESRIRILSEKSQFIFDPIGETDASIQKTNSDRRWKHFGRSECPDQALALVGELGKREGQWIAFQEPIHLDDGDRWRSLAWCSYRDGALGSLHEVADSVNSNEICLLLENPMVRVLTESLFSQHSTWDKFLNPSRLEHFAVKKPSLFRNTSLNVLSKKLENKHSYLSVANDQLGLSMKPMNDGVELLSFSSLHSFARRTGIGSLVNEVQRINSTKHRPSGDIFRLGWLSMCWRNCKETPIFLKLHWGALVYLIANLDLSGRVTPKELLSSIVMKFGPPELFLDRA